MSPRENEQRTKNKGNKNNKNQLIIFSINSIYQPEANWIILKQEKECNQTAMISYYKTISF